MGLLLDWHLSVFQAGSLAIGCQIGVYILIRLLVHYLIINARSRYESSLSPRAKWICLAIKIAHSMQLIAHLLTLLVVMEALPTG